MASMVHRCLNGRHPFYLADQCRQIGQRPIKLPSTNSWTLVVPRKSTTFGDRAFRPAGPPVWNSWPPTLRENVFVCFMMTTAPVTLTDSSEMYSYRHHHHQETTVVVVHHKFAVISNVPPLREAMATTKRMERTRLSPQDNTNGRRPQKPMGSHCHKGVFLSTRSTQ